MAITRATYLSECAVEDDSDEEPGEEIDSAPPQEVGEERELNSSGLKKRLLKLGHGWETPDINDEVTGTHLSNILVSTERKWNKRLSSLLCN